MIRHLKRLGLPLLAKELIEQSSRRRTYVVRVAYASLLFFTSFLMFFDELRVGTTSPMAVLGKGRELFMYLVALQFGGIYLFLPAMTCGVVTQEKERASLQLLFLTRLGPWTILFEKLFGRLIPMLYFLMLSLPLLAFAYTLGGLTPQALLIGIWVIVLAVLQMGTLALFCSAYFRTTVGAFIWSYLFGIMMFFGPALGWLVVKSVSGFDILQTLRRSSGSVPGWEVLAEVPLFGLVHFIVAVELRGVTNHWHLVWHSVLAIAQSGVCLVLARACLVRRAFLAPRNAVLNVFRVLDRIFVRLNNNAVTRGVVFVRDAAALPDQDPVAWRETTKRSLGKGRYLARVFVALEIPVAVLCVMTIVVESVEPLSLLLLVVWVVALLMVAAQAASLIAGERTHQTLDVLSTTPLTGREIIRQKFRAVLRLMLVLCIPLLTIVMFEASMRWRMPDPRQQYYPAGFKFPEFQLGVYLVCSLLSVAIYLLLAAWMSFYIGLRLKTQARAIVVSVGALLAWCLGPLIFLMLPIEILFRPNPTSGTGFLFLFSPIAMVGMNEEHQWRELLERPWLAMFLNFTWYGSWLLFFRWLCLRHADRLLGRVEIHEIDEIVRKRANESVERQPELTQV